MILTEENPPFNYTLDNRVTGIAVDVLLSAAESADIDIELSDIKIVPWARGYQMVTDTPGTILFSMARTESRDNQFQWVGPIAPLTIAVIGPTGLGLDQIQDLAGLRIGTIRDGAPEQLLLAQDFPVSDLHRGTSFEAIIHMMAAGRIDLIAYNVISARYKMIELGIDPDSYETVVILRNLELWYGVNKDTNPELISRLQQGINEIKASGEYDKIVADYLEN